MKTVCLNGLLMSQYTTIVHILFRVYTYRIIYQWSFYYNNNQAWNNSVGVISTYMFWVIFTESPCNLLYVVYASLLCRWQNTMWSCYGICFNEILIPNPLIGCNTYTYVTYARQDLAEIYKPQSHQFSYNMKMSSTCSHQQNKIMLMPISKSYDCRIVSLF